MALRETLDQAAESIDEAFDQLTSDIADMGGRQKRIERQWTELQLENRNALREVKDAQKLIAKSQAELSTQNAEIIELLKGLGRVD